MPVLITHRPFGSHFSLSSLWRPINRRYKLTLLLLLAITLTGCQTLFGASRHGLTAQQSIKVSTATAAPQATSWALKATELPPEPRPIDVLFIAYDNGDGRAFQKLLPELSQRGISWHTLAFGPAGNLFPDYQHATNLNNQLSAPERERFLRDRNLMLPTSIPQDQVKRFQPRIVITGMAHTGQAQLTRAYWNQGAWTIAFYDNMAPPQGQAWVTPWLEQQIYPVVEELLVPTSTLVNTFPDNYTYQHSVTPVLHPTLKDWQDTFAFVDRDKLRASLQLDQRPVVLIAGGYGKAYEESRLLMARAARARPDIQWLLTPHPRRMNNAFGEVRPIDDPIRTIAHVSTAHAATIADMVMSHSSSSGWMAAQMGIPVLFVQPESPSITRPNTPIQTVNSLPTLLNAVHRALDNPLLEQPNLPPTPKIDIVDIIEDRLIIKQPKPPQIEFLGEGQ